MIDAQKIRVATIIDFTIIVDDNYICAPSQLTSIRQALIQFMDHWSN